MYHNVPIGERRNHLVTNLRDFGLDISILRTDVETSKNR